MKHATKMIAWSRDESVMAVVTGRYKVELWKGSPLRMDTLIERRSEDVGLEYVITGIAFSPDGTLLCCSGQAGFTIWQLPEAKLIADFNDSTVFISEITFSADSSQLVACEHVVSGELLQPGRIPVGTSISRWSISDGRVSRTGQTSLAFTVAKFSNSGTELCYVAPKQPNVVQLARLAE
jgi:WD40 repeat protein